MSAVSNLGPVEVIKAKFTGVDICFGEHCPEYLRPCKILTVVQVLYEAINIKIRVSKVLFDISPIYFNKKLLLLDTN